MVRIRCSKSATILPDSTVWRAERKKVSEYGTQLSEKQKAKYTYGLLEKQFSRTYEQAARMGGITGENLLKLLECRLDNVVYRLGIAPTRAAARQLVSHCHICVNGNVVNIPSYSLRAGDVVSVREKSKSLEVISASLCRLVEEPLRLVGVGQRLDERQVPAEARSVRRFPRTSRSSSSSSCTRSSNQTNSLIMAILAFQKPEKVIMLESTSSFGKFEFRPLEPGFGMTVGNALRRILLSSLEGYAITTVKVAGVDHEFAAIPGVMEDMLNIILNLKQVRFIRTVDDQDAEKVSINVAGVTELTAGYISNYLSFFKVLNPDLVICHLAPGTKMQMTLTIGKGRGYVPAEENAPAESEFGTLPIDSIFTPIKNVKYSIEDYRVEQRTDYEKLNLEITTDGSIHPKEALKEAAKILIQHFMLFSDEKITVNMEDTNGAEEFDEDVLHMRQLLKTKLSDAGSFGPRPELSESRRRGYCGDLVKLNRNDLLKFRNFGKKSLTELDELLTSLNLKFGMDVSIYKLDKD